MNECINSGMSKTAWCRANGISEKQFFYWQRILRREAFENSRNSSLPAAVGPDQELAPVTQRMVLLPYTNVWNHDTRLKEERYGV